MRELPRPSALPPAATHEGHRGTVAAGEGSTDVEVERVVQPGGDGNAVSLEREMAKVAANDLRYQSLTRATRHHLGMLRYAATTAADDLFVGVPSA
ncbi:MAG: hypothetical protein R3B99_19310 [Polyangiales bacterium]